jgi:hypothetical protein
VYSCAAVASPLVTAIGGTPVLLKGGSSSSETFLTVPGGDGGDEDTLAKTKTCSYINDMNIKFKETNIDGTGLEFYFVNCLKIGQPNCTKTRTKLRFCEALYI